MPRFDLTRVFSKPRFGKLQVLIKACSLKIYAQEREGGREGGGGLVEGGREGGGGGAEWVLGES